MENEYLPYDAAADRVMCAYPGLTQTAERTEQTDKQSDKLTDRHKDRQTDRQTQRYLIRQKGTWNTNSYPPTRLRGGNLGRSTMYRS